MNNVGNACGDAGDGFANGWEVLKICEYGALYCGSYGNKTNHHYMLIQFAGIDPVAMQGGCVPRTQNSGGIGIGGIC